MTLATTVLVAASTEDSPSSQHLVEALDWAGRFGVVGALLGFGLAVGLRARGYRRVRRIGRRTETLPIAPIDMTSVWEPMQTAGEYFAPPLLREPASVDP